VPSACLRPIESPTVFKRDKLAPYSAGGMRVFRHRRGGGGLESVINCALSAGGYLRLISHTHTHTHTRTLGPQADSFAEACWCLLEKLEKVKSARLFSRRAPSCQFLFLYPLTWLVFSQQLITTINLQRGKLRCSPITSLNVIIYFFRHPAPSIIRDR